MSLYPLIFKPRFVPKMWGGQKLQTVLGKTLPSAEPIGESWELFDFPPGVVDGSKDWVSAEVSNGPLKGKTLHQLVQQFGADLHGGARLVAPHGQFPILIKFLDAKEDLSVQVHPDAKYAAAHPGAHLKSEAWYVMENDPGARIMKGLRPGVTKSQFKDSIAAGKCEQLIEAIPVKPGQCFYLPSGTIHALGAGILVAEVQTPSDTTFRVYDFKRIDPSTGKERTLHVEQALECIDFSNKPEPKQPRGHVGSLFTTVSRLVTCDYFKLEKVRMTEGVEEPVPYDEPVVWIMLEGKASIRVDGVNEPTTFKKGDTILLPAKMKNPTIKVEQDSVWLEVTFPTKAEV